MERLLTSLRELDALRDIPTGDGQGDTLTLRAVESAEPVYANESILESLPQGLQNNLKAIGISKLYTHQAEALARARLGEDLILESPTASGKTLCFNIPLIERLLLIPKARGMMLHPMKALSNDQRRQFELLTRGLVMPGGRPIDSWLYDGDTEQEHRAQLRLSPPSLLLTNPEMLHLSFLGNSHLWEKDFLRWLNLIVIDEIHEYRGFFGTNVALLFRRFLSKLDDLGVRPQLILATATCANPVEHAERLTGRKFSLIRGSSAMRPRRHYAFVNPAIPDFRFHEIFLLRIARAGLACLKEGLATLIFCPSRKFAEAVCIRAQRDAEQFGLDPHVIVPYRSGYTAGERREIEDGMRSGKYRVVFSTNALEIGIDIGRLDACILAGFPDNVMSAWQRIGRTGRNWDRDAYVLFYAMNNAIDQFFAANIDTFLDRSLDEILIGVDNEELIAKHVQYLLHECSWALADKNREAIGPAFFEQAKLRAQGAKPIAGRGPYYPQLSIRGGSGATNKLMFQGEEIGTISDVHAFREAHVGAIYNHRGRSYRVAAHGAGEILLEGAEPFLKSEPSFYTVIRQGEILKGQRFEEIVGVFYGKVVIFENFTGYRIIDERTGSLIEENRAAIALPKNVRSFWLTVEPSATTAVDKVGGLRVVEQFLRIGSSFTIPCDRHDMGTWTDVTTAPTVYFYETVPGGIGIAEKSVEVWRKAIEKGVQLANRCNCTEGCPRCIHPPRYRATDAPLIKSVGIEYARWLLSITAEPAKEIFDSTVHGWRTA